MKKQIFLVSLGCARNLVDSEVILGVFAKAGYLITTILEEADVVVINTCGFLESARRESLEAIEAIFRGKKSQAKVILTGCMLKQHRELLKQNFPEVTYFLNPGDFASVVELVEGKAEKVVKKAALPRLVSTPSSYAYLKIAEGCAKRCSYCLIPKIKGPLKSRSVNEVVKEFKDLLKTGFREIVLIAQDLGDYGKDLPGKPTLSLLLKELLKVKKDFWLRLLYLYPDEINDELIALLKSDARICPYLDLPIQHINDTILAKMKRKTSKKQIISIIRKLRKEIPDIVLRTSLIVGFPGETEEAFKELVEFIQAYPFEHLGVFKYSKEEGTAAFKLPDQISEKVKTKRYATLLKVQQSISLAFNKKLLGKTLSVLVEDYHPENRLLLVGRHQRQAPEVDGLTILNEWSKVQSFGEVHSVKVTDAALYDIIGKVIS